jgi:hypothetical protein
LEYVSGGPKGGEMTRALIYGFPFAYGGLESPVAIALVHYFDGGALNLADRHLPAGLSVIGLVEFDSDEEQDVYAVMRFVMQIR